MRLDYLSNDKYFRWIAFFTIIFIAGGCSNESRNPQSQTQNEQDPYVMVIKYQSDEYSTGIANQVTKALEYAKIPFSTLDLEIISGEFSIPESVKSIVITSFEASQLPRKDIEQLIAFAAKGNSIVFTGPFTGEKFTYLQGIRSDTDYSADSTNTGFMLFEEAFPGMQDKSYNPSGLQPHNGLKANQFRKQVEILAGTATDPNVPFIISNKIGLGEVVTVNSYAINSKIYRGLLYSVILRGLSGVPYQVANVSTIFLDDFPAPLYNEKMPPIAEEYDVTHAEFVSKIWWPDMKALADTFDITYSAMTAFNYNANVVPPFDFQEWRQGSIVFNQNIVRGSIFLAKDIRDTRHELAFHGYNHFSLWRQDWDNMNFMISSLQAARKRWRVDDMGDLPVNYVPPTNNIDSLGIQAIIRGMPSIKYMSSLYIGEIEDGGGREFDPEPYAPGELFNYPRISSGFTMAENSLFDQMGLQLLTGIWTHFVHPDDVFQVVQRDADDYASRNPLELGWMSDPEYGHGLYHLLERRIQFTKKLYPNNKFLSATQASRYTEDWRRSLSGYEEKDDLLLVTSKYRPNYQPKSEESSKQWFMYITDEQVKETELVLNLQDIGFARTHFWDGFLYQFQTNKASFFVPNFNHSIFYKKEFLDQLAQNEIQNFAEHAMAAEGLQDTLGEWRDTRFEDALKAWKANPGEYSRQEELIDLSIEFSEVSYAITILENRLLNNDEWKEQDQDRLITYYGWEGKQEAAKVYLEKLWEKHKNRQVIHFKNQAVDSLGLYGQDFERRWRKRELELSPNDYETLLAYTKSIESEENWPEMKQNLQKLLQMNPQTDSLYAFTLQRSFYYDPPDSTVALVEKFPRSAYQQLMPYAENLATLYAYEAGDYEQALFWANNAQDFDERQKLYWLAELNLKQLYLANALNVVANNPEDDSLRSFVGTNLFYQGFQQEGYKVLYPLFQKGNEAGFAADTLVRAEIGYLSYPQKKEFYQQYPHFFDEDQLEGLQEQHRRTEGVRAALTGEYRDDNFDNTFARGALSVQFGNRQRKTHTVKAENLIFSDDDAQTTTTMEYYGLGYEFSSRWKEQQLEFRAGTSVLFREQDVIPEALVSLGYSHDSTYTSVQLTGGPELTSTSIQNDYYQAEVQLYRQDFWWDGNLATGISGTGKYYTNEVFEYGGQGRVFGNLVDQKWRLRTIGELGYYDATESFLNGIPYYTPDKYFSQGMGLDLQFRNPDTFEYRTQIDAEVMAKHEQRDGFFFSGGIQFEHKFRNFWEISAGTEISTSKVYRSNRVFITISHYFPTKFVSRSK